MRIRSPDPVEGRKHIDVQTELYLEEITGEFHLFSPNRPTTQPLSDTNFKFRQSIKL